jgi:hypothetical protein
MQPAGRLIGANPIAALTNRGERVAVVSMWDVAWSTHGAGRAVLVWVGGDESIRLLTPHEHLGSWLGQTFNRHFPEFEGLPEIADPIDCDITEWLIEPDRARWRLLPLVGCASQHRSAGRCRRARAMPTPSNSETCRGC